MTTETHPLEPMFLADKRLAIDPEALAVEVDGRRIHVPPRELSVITYVAAHPDVPAKRYELCETFWGEHTAQTDASLRTTVGNFRRRIGPDLGHPFMGGIRTTNHHSYVGASTLLQGQRWVADETGAMVYTFADERIDVDVDNELARRDGEVMEGITPVQFDLLSLFGQNVGVVLSISRICMELSGVCTPHEMNRVRVHLSGLRKHLGPKLGHSRKGGYPNYPCSGL